MKRLFIICLFFLFVYPLKIRAYSVTGHEIFSEITFKEKNKIIIKKSKNEIDQKYYYLRKPKFMGWKHYYFNMKEEATYVGEVLFAKSNRSRDPIKIDYKYKDTNTNERSVTYGGSLSGKFKKKIKGIDAEVNAKIEGSIKNVTSNQTIEETSFSVTIMPNTRMIFRETGDCLVTNGVSKYYILGITFNKGEWEYIDIVTRYYELFEEEIA